MATTVCVTKVKAIELANKVLREVKKLREELREESIEAKIKERRSLRRYFIFCRLWLPELDYDAAAEIEDGSDGQWRRCNASWKVRAAQRLKSLCEIAHGETIELDFKEWEELT